MRPVWGDVGGGGRKECPDAAAGPSVIDIIPPRIPDTQIYVIGGTNLRPLRGGLGLCAPCRIDQCFRVPKPFWMAAISTLLSVRNINLLTSENPAYRHNICA